MHNSFNVLITSLSSKVPLIREVRKALSKISAVCKLIGADSNPHCIGRYFVNDFWEMPLTERLDPAEVVQYCIEKNIKAVIPTRDKELPFYAQHKKLFQDNGIAVMVSSFLSVQQCFDKISFYNTLKDHCGLNPIVTCEQPDAALARRWVVKERSGSGSRNLLIDITAEDARSASGRFENPIFQPYIKGVEFTIDLYVAKNGIPKGGVVRTRDLVVHGESQVSTTVDRSDIREISFNAATIIGLTGHALFQVIEDTSGILHIVECNCRFGGASTLSVAAGLKSFDLFFRECLGDDLSGIAFIEGQAGLRQIRYSEDKIIQVDPNNHAPSNV